MSIVNKILCKRFPFLIPVKPNGERVEDKEHSSTCLDMLPPGWKKLGVSLAIKLRPILKSANYLDKFKIIKMGEKWGELKVYYACPIPEEIYNQVEYCIYEISKKSNRICINCGRKRNPERMMCKKCLKTMGVNTDEL